MGRTTAWLAAKRPAMVTALNEMARGYLRQVGSDESGDLSAMLIYVADATRSMRKGPRELAAMRQAWWRWTTDKSDPATPAAPELAAVFRLARNRGWLGHLTDPDALALVQRLQDEFDRIEPKQRRAQELAWNPEAREGVYLLMKFLEKRISKLAGEEADGMWGASLPAALVVQEEVRTMVIAIIEQVVIQLQRPREAFSQSHPEDSFIQPFNGWPEAFRGLATSVSELLKSAAVECAEWEASHLQATGDAGRDKRKRINLFGRKPQDPSAEDMEP